MRLLGFSEYTLRLVPFACSIASLFLFRHLAGLLLRGTALVATFGIFAVAYPPIRYAAEAKPYGCDLFLALVMLVDVGPLAAPAGRTGWLWGLAALIAPAVGFSYPAVFVGGGVSLIVGYVLWTTGRRGWTALDRFQCPPGRRFPGDLGGQPWGRRRVESEGDGRRCGTNRSRR